MDTEQEPSVVTELVKRFEEDEETTPPVVPGPTWRREPDVVQISVREVKEPSPGRVPPSPRAPSPDSDSSSTASPMFDEVISIMEGLRVGSQGRSRERSHETHDDTFSSSSEDEAPPLACPVCRSTCLVSVCQSCYKNEKALLQGEARHEFLARAQLETKLLKFAEQYGELAKVLQETEAKLHIAQDSSAANVSMARVQLENKVILVAEQNNDLKQRLREAEARLKHQDEERIDAEQAEMQARLNMAVEQNSELKRRLVEAEDRLKEIEDRSTADAFMELEGLKEKLVATEARLRQVEEMDGDEAFAEARVIIQRQSTKIEELSAELQEKKQRYFDNIEDLAEGKMLMKQQQRRISELHEEASTEKRNRAKAEEWLFQLRDECVRLKDAVGEREKLRNDINSLLYSREELDRKYQRLKESYHQLWDRNEELESVFLRKDHEVEKLRAGWEYTSNELHRVQGCVRSLQNYNEHLKTKLREVQIDQADKYHEALEAASRSGIDKLSDTHVEALTSNLTKLTGSAVDMFFPSDANPGTTIKKLMAAMHPDRTSIPACKETLQKRFQLLNHLKSLLV